MSKTAFDVIAEIRTWMKSQDTHVGRRAIAIARLVDRFKVEEYLDELEAAYKGENHCEKRYDKDGDEMPPHCAFYDLKIDRLKGKVKELEARTGNVGKMRSALERIRNGITIDGNTATLTIPISEINGIAETALASPIRNCDTMPPIDKLTIADLSRTPCKSTLIAASREELLALVRWMLSMAEQEKGGHK